MNLFMLEIVLKRPFISIFSLLIYFLANGSSYAEERKPLYAAPGIVSYKISLRNTDPVPYFLVEMTFPSTNIATFTLRRFGRQEFDQCVERDLEIVSVRNARRTQKTEPLDHILSAAPTGSGPVIITYKIIPKLRGFSYTVGQVSTCDPIILTKNNFYIDGRGFFPAQIMVDHSGNTFRIEKAELSFQNIPEHWEMITSLGNLELNQPPKTYDRWRLRDAQYLAGTITFASFQSGKKKVSLATVGHSPEYLDAMQNAFKKVMPYFNHALGEVKPYRHSIFLMPASASPYNFSGYVGVAKWDSQGLFFTPFTNVDKLILAMTHELSHRWVPGKIGRLEKGKQGSWIREGIPEYISYKALVDLELEPFDALVTRLNLAQQNLALKHTEELFDYDEGLLLAFSLDRKTWNPMESPPEHMILFENLWHDRKRLWRREITKF